MRWFRVRSKCLLLAVLCFVSGALLFRVLPNPFSSIHEADYVDRPDGFLFRNHRRVEGQPTFTVSGELVNASGAAWKRVEVVTSIYAGQAYMTYCVKELRDVAKGSTRRFVLVCRETAGSGLPGNVTYELAVRKAVPE